jgi:hypothetical protein
MTCSASCCRFRVHPNCVCCGIRACWIHPEDSVQKSAFNQSSPPSNIRSRARYAQWRESTFSISAGAVVVVDAELLLTQTLFFVMGTRQWTRLARELCIEKVACPMWAFISARRMEIYSRASALQRNVILAAENLFTAPWKHAESQVCHILKSAAHDAGL